jgi:hypothetical protein
VASRSLQAADAPARFRPVMLAQAIDGEPDPATGDFARYDAQDYAAAGNKALRACYAGVGGTRP